MAYDIQIKAWDRHNHVAGLSWLMGSRPHPDISISNAGLETNKR
jgi:hypothetical protein